MPEAAVIPDLHYPEDEIVTPRKDSTDPVNDQECIKGKVVSVTSKSSSNGKRSSGSSGAKSNKKPRSEASMVEKDPSILQPFNIPQWRFTPVIPDPRGVTLSPYDRAPQLRLAEENLTVSGHKGYRLIRATHGVSVGSWYFEVTIREDYMNLSLEDKFLNIEGHCRVGWARGCALIQAPLGYDRFGYGVCSRTGDSVHVRRLKEYACPLKKGDVVGCYLYLPAIELSKPEEVDSNNSMQEDGADQTQSLAPADQEGSPKTECEAPTDVETKMGMRPEKSKSKVKDRLTWRDTEIEYYLEEDTDVGSEICRGSVIRFFVNGEPYGAAFQDIEHGIYYPAASVYMGGQVTFNFGPTFKYGMSNTHEGEGDVKAMSEAALIDNVEEGEAASEKTKSDAAK